MGLEQCGVIMSSISKCVCVCVCVVCSKKNVALSLYVVRHDSNREKV